MPAGVLSRGLVREICGRRRRHIHWDWVAALRQRRRLQEARRRPPGGRFRHRRRRQDPERRYRHPLRRPQPWGQPQHPQRRRLHPRKGAKLLWRCLGVRKDLVVRLTQRRRKHGIRADPVFAGRWRLLFFRRSLLPSVGLGVSLCVMASLADSDPKNSDRLISTDRNPIDRKIEANCSPEQPVNEVIAPLTTNPFEVRWLGKPPGPPVVSPAIAARIMPARRSTTSTRTTRSPHVR